MAGQYTHVVQLRLTSEEWRLVAEIAGLRRVSVEDLLREGLRLSQRDAQPPVEPRPGSLRLVGPGAPPGRRVWRRR
ncbi:MAG TPA: hypothetical protein VMF09_10610 [Solirubrobacteraceae bacterium]|nr:hypothetical protein [Solirubrobacteraceae bacterium]